MTQSYRTIYESKIGLIEIIGLAVDDESGELALVHFGMSCVL